MYAAERGRAQLAESLVAWGADPRKRSNDGESTLMCAVRSGNVELLDYVMELAAPVGEEEWAQVMQVARSTVDEVRGEEIVARVEAWCLKSVAAERKEASAVKKRSL
jgi:hypothetical protein